MFRMVLLSYIYQSPVSIFLIKNVEKETEKLRKCEKKVCKLRVINMSEHYINLSIYHVLKMF